MKIQEFDYGSRVVCDWCSKEWSDSETEGGFLFAGKATCPECAAEMEAAAVAYGEQGFITARCPPGQSFADFVRGLRGPLGGRVRLVSFGRDEDVFAAIAAAVRLKSPPD